MTVEIEIGVIGVIFLGVVVSILLVGRELKALRRLFETYLGLLEPMDTRSPLAVEAEAVATEDRKRGPFPGYWESDKARAEELGELGEEDAE